MYKWLLFTHLVISGLKYQQIARKPKRDPLPGFSQGEFRDFHNHSVCHDDLYSHKCTIVVEPFSHRMIARPKRAGVFSPGLSALSPNLPLRTQVTNVINA